VQLQWVPQSEKFQESYVAPVAPLSFPHSAGVCGCLRVCVSVSAVPAIYIVYKVFFSQYANAEQAGRLIFRIYSRRRAQKRKWFVVVYPLCALQLENCDLLLVKCVLLLLCGRVIASNCSINGTCGKRTGTVINFIPPPSISLSFLSPFYRYRISSFVLCFISTNSIALQAALETIGLSLLLIRNEGCQCILIRRICVSNWNSYFGCICLLLLIFNLEHIL